MTTSHYYAAESHRCAKYSGGVLRTYEIPQGKECLSPARRRIRQMAGTPEESFGRLANFPMKTMLYTCSEKLDRWESSPYRKTRLRGRIAGLFHFPPESPA